MDLIINIAVFLIAAVIFTFVGMFLRKKTAEAKLKGAENEAQRIIEMANKEAENKKKEEIFNAKEEIMNARKDLDQEIRERRGEVQQQERRIIQKEENLERKIDLAEKKEKDLLLKDEELEKKKNELDEILNKSNMTLDEIDAIGVTYGPGLIGSLLIGVQAAKTIALVTGKPLIPVHHIAGHIYANNLEKRLQFPLIALVVSGGHSELIYMKEDYSFERIGGTLDDAVGECYDKVGKVIGVPYPGGPKVDKLAHEGKDTYDLPYPLDDKSYNFSFSGIKSAVINLVHNEKQRGNEINVYDLATSFQDVVVDILTKKTMRALKEYNVKNLILAGGVSANKGLRDSLEEACKKENIDFSVPRMSYCTDNAAMIGAAAYYAYKKGIVADQTLTAMATDTLYKYK